MVFVVEGLCGGGESVGRGLKSRLLGDFCVLFDQKLIRDALVFARADVPVAFGEMADASVIE